MDRALADFKTRFPHNKSSCYEQGFSSTEMTQGTGPSLNLSKLLDVDKDRAKEETRNARTLNAQKVRAMGSREEGPIKVQVYGYRVRDWEYTCPDPKNQEEVQAVNDLFCKGLLYTSRETFYLTQEQYQACQQ